MTAPQTPETTMRRWLKSIRPYPLTTLYLSAVACMSFAMETLR